MLGRLILWGIELYDYSEGQVGNNRMADTALLQVRKLFIKRASAKTTGAFLFFLAIKSWNIMRRRWLK